MNRTTRHLTQAAGCAALAITSLLATAPAAGALTPAAAARVTDGWSAVVVGTGNAAGTLQLVSPGGARYTVRTGLGVATQVEDVSHDGHHVLLSDWYGGGRRHRLVDTRTGALATYEGRWSEMRFTRPTGRAVIARTTPATGTQPGSLQRLSLDTRRPTVTGFRGTAGGDGMLPSPDGTLLVSRNARHQVQVNQNATGAVVRTLVTPRGMDWCVPQHFTDASHLTAWCGRDGDGASQVYRLDTRGGRPTPLTAHLPRTGSLQWGYLDSWQVGGRQVVAAASPCGPSRIATVEGTRVRLVRTLGEGSTPLGVVGGAVYHVNTGGCGEDSWSLSRVDLASGRTTLLVGGTRNPGVVVRSVRLVDATQ